MFVDEIRVFKSINMAQELTIAGEFIYDSVKKTMSITGLNNPYEINAILYTGSVGIERLQKIYLCLVAKDPTDESSMPKCLKQHNHLRLQDEVDKYVEERPTKHAIGMLGMFANYYNKFRYANYIPGQHVDGLRELFISFLKKINGKFDFSESYAAAQFRIFKRFYINELGKLAVYYYHLIREKAFELDIFTYEIDSYSKASRVFWTMQRRTLYEQMVLEQEAVKELLLYIYKGKRLSGVFKLLNEMEPLEFDNASVNEYLEALCAGNVDDLLIDYVEDLYVEIEDKKERAERKELLSLIGNTSVLFDCEEEDYFGDDKFGI